jgi:hypothetical protein
MNVRYLTYSVPKDTCRLIQCFSMNIKINNDETILDTTSPSIIRYHSFGPVRGTGSDRTVGAPRIILRDIDNVSYIQSTKRELWYRNDIYNIQRLSYFLTKYF